MHVLAGGCVVWLGRTGWGYFRAGRPVAGAAIAAVAVLAAGCHVAALAYVVAAAISLVGFYGP